MKNNKASWTAEITAIYRAAESIRPREDRICYDYYAKDFLRTSFRLILKSRILTKIALWCAVERRFPGGIASTVVRIRFIDDCLKQCIDEGIEQLVILGAGYDSRAYRFDRLKALAGVFEVDHPATQKMKKNKVRKIFGDLPKHVAYVPVDFENEKLDEKLLQSSYKNNMKTLFIWEGVSKYLTADAVDAVLAFVTNNSGKGSSIVFDYLFKYATDTGSDLKLVKRILSYQAKKSEPYIFGLQEREVEQFMWDRGFPR
ncbi:MAG: SAM-dependent methyltransferase [Desulfobacteraceae bacterium]|nr:SAM-dependent methyltransferase [Desulfobacteraceae bacterium]